MGNLDKHFETCPGEYVSCAQTNNMNKVVFFLYIFKKFCEETMKEQVTVSGVYTQHGDKGAESGQRTPWQKHSGKKSGINRGNCVSIEKESEESGRKR